MSLWKSFFISALLIVTTPCEPSGEPKAELVFEIPARAKFSFGGLMGKRIERNIDAWLLPAPLANPGILEMFRVRDRKPEPKIVPWAGEFAGKYLISAVQALRMADRQDLREWVGRFVEDLISTQAEDGYLGPFPRRERLLGHWDLWGHYHIIQGLLLWHRDTGSNAALLAAQRAADLICKTYLDTGRRVFDAGSPEMNMAVLHGLGMLYRLTGKGTYLRMMREIEKDWERGGDYFRQGLAGVEFYRTPRPRWESLHDVQGLVELYRITGDPRYRTAFVNLWKSIARLDRHNTGGFSSGEQAVGHPYSPAPIETCCTIAWMALTADMLRLTGEPAAADELELSTFNGMLGSQHPSGRWWTYNTPMDGVREASDHTIVFQARAGTPELNCCSVNAPRGLGMLSEWALMVDSQGPIVNSYGPLKATLNLESGTRLHLEEETEYPIEGRVRLVLHPERKEVFTLRLRIPRWSQETLARTGGGALRGVVPGTYLTLRREWNPGDWIELEFDLSLRIWAGDREAAGKISIYRGPILLAYDQRFNRFDEEDLPSLDVKILRGRKTALEPIPPEPLSPWILLKLPGSGGKDVRLCDFASAGARGTRYRSWLPAVNVPPPPVLLDRPEDGGKIPEGKALFAWGGRRRSRAVEAYTLLISPSREFSDLVVELRIRRNRAVTEKAFEPGRDYFWKVRAENSNGTAESEARSFQVDPDLPPLPEAAVAFLEPGPGGLLISDPLRGEPRPSRGALLDATGVKPAPGPAGDPKSGVAFDGKRGRIRYAIPYFPEREYTVLVRVAPGEFPEGRIAQIFSAWAKAMDDPLRITIEGGRIFARIESGRGFSTEGIPLQRGRWIHVAAVKSGSKLTLIIDGEEKSSVEVPEEVYSDAQNVALGGNPNYSGNEFLSATMADFALYARALGLEEIRKLSKKR